MITIVENIHQKNIKREKVKQIDVHKCGLGDICTFRLNLNNKKTNVEIYMWVKLNFPVTERDFFFFACDMIAF